MNVFVCASITAGQVETTTEEVNKRKNVANQNMAFT